ncbi:MAG TPA: ABC transporter substrate-binding protein [Candidatus Binataceae bacterium]|nr:ABC transporter substrate-binding protein [Candidatus Binataceae bacterium]
MTRQLTLGLSLSLTGKYAAMGRQGERALRLFVADANEAGGVIVRGQHYDVALRCLDDASRIDRAREIYRELCFGRPCDLIFGPYSSGLTRVAAPLCEEAGRLMINHGGAADQLHAHNVRMLVSVLTPASAYMTGLIDLLATLKFWRKRLAVATAPTPFAGAISAGLERAAKTRRAWLHGVRLRMKYAGTFRPEHTPASLSRAIRRNRINAFVSAGGYDYDLAMMRVASARELKVPVLGCVAAGVERFRQDLGDDAEGIVGPSQWERDFNIVPELGPRPAEFSRRILAAGSTCDYPAAQIYAAGLITLAAVRACDSLDQVQLRAAFADLRTTTFFGDFAIDRETGRQIGHQMLLVQWHEGRKQIIDPEPQAEGGNLEFPSAWRMILGAADLFRLSRREKIPDETNPPPRSF